MFIPYILRIETLLAKSTTTAVPDSNGELNVKSNSTPLQSPVTLTAWILPSACI